MNFGPVPTAEAAGAIAAHSLRAGSLSIRKGKTLSTADVEALLAAGIDQVVAVRLDPGDVGEDAAAARLAQAMAGTKVRVDAPFTGRCNLFASTPGLLVVSKDRIDAINAVDESITLATLPAYKPVVEGEMIGTVKIIPYAVPAPVLDRALAEAIGADRAVEVAPYTISRVGVISTLAPGLKPITVAKTREALAARLEPAGARIIAEATCPHGSETLAEELVRQVEREAELIVVFGASAIADRRDVIPAAIEVAGGSILHFGMPVDPGNLLLLGEIGGKPVIGAPGCARSSKENGFDWVLQRLVAGLPVTRADITSMGVGGLLMEIVSRGQPRAGGESGDEG